MPAPRDQRHRAGREQDPAQRSEGMRRIKDVHTPVGDRGPGELHREHHQR